MNDKTVTTERLREILAQPWMLRKGDTVAIVTELLASRTSPEPGE